jgi:hypothetical protein
VLKVGFAIFVKKWLTIKVVVVLWIDSH